MWVLGFRCLQMAPDSISECANLKIFLGEHAPRPPSGLCFACSPCPPNCSLALPPLIMETFCCPSCMQTIPNDLKLVGTCQLFLKDACCWVHCIILCLFASVHWPTFKFYFFLPPWILRWCCGNFINFYRLECRLCGRTVTSFLPKILRKPTRKQSRRTTKSMTSTSSQSANYISVFMPSLYLLLWWYLTIIMVILRLWHLY